MTEEIDPRQALRQISGLWWLTVLLGVLGVIAGIIVLARPSKSLELVAVVTGIFVVIDGVVALAAAITNETENRGLAAVFGVVSLIVGILLIRHPTHGVLAIALLFGFWLIAMGAARLVLAFGMPTHRGWRVFVALIELIAGIVIVSSPSIGVATLALLVGLTLIINGAAFAALGVVLRRAGKGDGLSGPPGPLAAA
jgi:uncharacterized membrane protein HdeD (DUF308 family)